MKYKHASLFFIGTTTIFLFSVLISDNTSFSPSWFSAPGEKSKKHRVYALGDLHGDFERTIAILRAIGVVDEHSSWIAETSTLVQTGDIVDRGPDARRLYSLMDRLARQASQQGGKVVSLWGNHEYMNALGDWRYVSAEDIRQFGGKRQRQAEFTAAGEIGKSWLARYEAAYRDPVVRAHFVHGGVESSWSTRDIGREGKALMENLLRYNMSDGHEDFWNATTRFDPSGFYESGGPVWSRYYASSASHNAESDDRCEMAFKVMRDLDVDYLVMGHTTFVDGIQKRCNDRLVFIDTGLSKAYGGRPSMLEFLHQNNEVVLFEHYL